MSGLDVGFDELLNQGMNIQPICNEIAAKIPVLKQKGYEEGYAAGQEAGGGGGYDEGFAAGREKEWSDFWDAFQINGARTAYSNTFTHSGWNDTTFFPKYDIVPSGSAVNMFYYCGVTNLKERLEQCGVTLDMSKVSSYYTAFSYCKSRELPPLDMSASTSAAYAFDNASSLVKAPLMNVSGTNAWTNAFQKCTALTDIGQESDAFGYFSASVNLSQTAILFNTDKMSLRALITSLMAQETPRQEDCFLLIGPQSRATLTINSDQKDQIDAYMKGYSDGALGFEQFQSACATINWSVLW